MLKSKFWSVLASSALSFEEPHNKISWKSTSNILLTVLNSPYQVQGLLKKINSVQILLDIHFGVNNLNNKLEDDLKLLKTVLYSS